MALSSGVGPHTAVLNTPAGSFLIEHGSVTQNCNRKTSTFSVAIAKNSPGAEAIQGIQDGDGTSVFVSCVAGSGTLISGTIDSIDFDYISGYIRVTGSDPSRDLHETKVSQKWQNLTGAQIISQLVGQVGLSASTNSIGLLAGKKLQQDFVKLADNVPISYLINKISEFDGAKWWVRNGVFNYATLGTTTGTYEVNCTPGSPIVSDAVRLSIRKNLRASANRDVVVKSYHSKDNKTYMGKSTVGGGGGGGGRKGSKTASYHVPNLDQAHADQHAKARSAEMARHKVTVMATVVGDPSIDVAMGLSVNTGDSLASTYEIDSISHEFGMSGYMMTITAKSTGLIGESGGGENG